MHLLKKSRGSSLVKKKLNVWFVKKLSLVRVRGVKNKIGSV